MCLHGSLIRQTLTQTLVVVEREILEEHYTPDSVVVRIRELNGEKTRCQLRLPRPCRSLWRADHLERPIEVIEGETGDEVHPVVQPYAILTLIAYM